MEKTLDGVRKERMIFLLVYNLIRLIMLRAAKRQGVNINRLSFADTLAWLRYGTLNAEVELKINSAAARTPGATRAQTCEKTVPAYDSHACRSEVTTPRQILGYRLTSWHCIGSLKIIPQPRPSCPAEIPGNRANPDPRAYNAFAMKYFYSGEFDGNDAFSDA